MRILRWFLLLITICGYLYMLCGGLFTLFMAHYYSGHGSFLFFLIGEITLIILALPLFPATRHLFYIFAGGWLLLEGVYIFGEPIISAIATDTPINWLSPYFVRQYIPLIIFGVYFLIMARLDYVWMNGSSKSISSE